MKKYFYLLLVFAFALPYNVYGRKKIDPATYLKDWSNYEVTTVAVGQNGTKALKVWGFGKNAEKAAEQAKKNAVHACLFRGCPGAANARSTPAIFARQGGGEVAAQNFEYFYRFFEEAEEYLQFVNLNTDGVPSGNNRREVKGGVKVTIYVQVMYDNLKEKMKRDGLLKNSSAAFDY